MTRLTLRSILLALVAAGIVLTAAEVSQAQRRGRGGMRPGQVSEVYLLQLSEVQAELKLTDEQKAKAAATLEKLAAGRSEVIANLPKEGGQRGPKIRELAKQAAEEVGAILDDAQRKRLHELILQVNGPNALQDDDVQTALKLTEEQKKKLREVSRENAKTRREMMDSYVGDRWEKSQELLKEANQKLFDVLTPEQQKQFDEMKGEKIEIDLYQT